MLPCYALIFLYAIWGHSLRRWNGLFHAR
jgi:hypothetical protein